MVVSSGRPEDALSLHVFVEELRNTVSRKLSPEAVRERKEKRLTNSSHMLLLSFERL